MKYFLAIFIFPLTFISHMSAQPSHEPTFEEIISLQNASNPKISPDGYHVVYQVRGTNWEHNSYITQLYLSKNGGKGFPITNHPQNSSSNPKWSPDGEWIAFTTKAGDHTQIHVIRLAGGAPFALTEEKGNVTQFKWSPDGSQIAFTVSPADSDEDEKRKEKYGSFAVEDEEIKLNQLKILDFKPENLGRLLLPSEKEDSTQNVLQPVQLLIDTTDFTVFDFEWSPDGSKIAFEHQPDPLINSFFHRDISLSDISSKQWEALVHHPSYDGLITWSPDGKKLLYESNLNDSTSNYYKNGKLFILSLEDQSSKQIAEAFDENIGGLVWNAQGIMGIAWQKTARNFVRIDPESGLATTIASQPERIYSMSFSADGQTLAYSGGDRNGLTEIYQSSLASLSQSPTPLTQFSQQIESWKVSDSEMISWKSEDGSIIEGVLHKPVDFDPSLQYPLLVMIHGGPTGISTPNPIPSTLYPAVNWLNKGAIILQPNYRGSAGYGEAFRSLNVRNLGVGDAWDVLSGVAYLEEQGYVDSEKMGAMGWSQGGYISAFLTTHTHKFKAISVGAGISNWMTYYVNTDIHPFTRQYLQATPWSDPDIYALTSPMTNISEARTPTLIQHGEYDKRVPPANAFELYQGLQDVGVETKLVIYKGFGHGISKPKERLAAMWHNWQWFNEHVWGEKTEMPLE